MLLELRIENVALIDKATISFTPGLNVLSGETGAGKSMVLEALMLLLGARASSSLIRTNAEALSVEALFDLRTVPKATMESLPDMAQGTELSLSRELNRSGRSKVYINGRLGSVALLEEIAGKLMSICGQHQHVTLLSPSYHCQLVDQFAGCEVLAERHAELYRAWRALEERLRAAETGARARTLRRAELQFLVEELGGKGLSETRRDDLEAEVRRLGNGERVQQILSEVAERFRAREGVITAVGEVAQMLLQGAKLDPDLQPLVTNAESLRAAARELDRDVAARARVSTVNEHALAELREQLAEVARLERKYRCTSAGLCELLRSAEVELAALQRDDDTDGLRREVDEARAALRSCSEQLSSERRKAAARLVKQVERELSEVNLVGSRLEALIEPCDPTPRGADRVEILFSSNAGQPPRPLREVASGGELSRLTLVLKKVLRDRSGVHVLVFDEVDAGISGGVARAVGEKLKALAAESQVICITHLPQIASLADSHLLVEKTQGKQAVSRVRGLTEPERVDEIARMLAGYEITAASRESARELLSSKLG